MVTRQEVRDAYRYILGREPESELAVDGHVNVADVNELRKRFVASAEFEILYAKREVQNHIESYVPAMDLPVIRVDTNASPSELQALLNRIKEEWEGFGRDEPHWSVLTHEAFKKASLADNMEEFFRSGKYVANIIQAFLARNGLTRNYGTCFELGCGVGRITLQLAKLFPRVIGADISRFHLDVCREELRRNQADNVELLCLTEVGAIRNIPSFDFFVSLIVLQHNPPPVIKLLLEAILRKLNPGGIAIFQVPTYRNGYSFDLANYLHKPTPLHMEMHVLPQQEVFSIITATGCRVVEVREDSFASGRTSQSLSNTFFVQRPLP